MELFLLDRGKIRFRFKVIGFMRVTFGTKYNQMNYHQNTMQNKLNNLNNKIASGLKIQQGYDDSSVFNQDLKLDYEVATLNQNIDVAKHAETRTLNTDKTLKELSDTLVQFKTKLIQAANDGQSETSRRAIASDLRGMKQHIINLANTSVGGEYIFAGSKIDKTPFDDKGNYYGNDEHLSALISSNNQVPYNITGKQLFFSRDADESRHITTNIKLLNQSMLHPDVMENTNGSFPSKEVFLKANDTIRDLIGDDDSDPSNDGKEFFYLRGVGVDGVAFKSKFSFDRGYTNSNSATTMQDLLDKIGREFGNTSQNKVVDVSLNTWGQIEIKDLRRGSSTIQFHMISSDKDVDNTDDLYKEGARITSYNKSPFLTDYTLDSLLSRTNYYNPAQLEFNTTFITKDNKLSDRNTMLSDIFSPDTKYLVLSNPNDAPTEEEEENLDAENPQDPENPQEKPQPKVLKIDVENTSIKDLIKEIEEFYDNKVTAEFTNGKLIILDQQAQKDNKASALTLALKTLDANGESTQGIATDFKNEYDKTYFANKGSKLIGNISQTLIDGTSIATENTKISEVIGDKITSKSFTLRLKDRNGVDVDAKITLDSKHSYLTLPSKEEGGEDYTIPLYNPHDAPPEVTATKADGVTYRQVMDAIAIALNYSDQDSNTLAKASQSITQEGKDAYEALLERANAKVSVNLDAQGRMVIQDKMASNTRMKFMLSSEGSNDFSKEGIKDARHSLVFNANNALTIDDPQINFFEQIDEIIDAVDRGIYRADTFDTYNEDMRNIGIQNGLSAFEHLSTHVEKMLALNGSNGKTFENIVRRDEILKTQIETMKAENIGIDMAETYNKFSNLNNNYNAVLNSTNRINQMSLVNYL